MNSHQFEKSGMKRPRITCESCIERNFDMHLFWVHDICLIQYDMIYRRFQLSKQSKLVTAIYFFLCQSTTRMSIYIAPSFSAPLAKLTWLRTHPPPAHHTHPTPADTHTPAYNNHLDSRTTHNSSSTSQTYFPYNQLHFRTVHRY